jgi:hypothetical protein
MAIVVGPVVADDDPPDPDDVELEGDGPAAFVKEESTVRNGAVSGVVPFQIANTREQQFYLKRGFKLMGIAQDDLKNLASMPLGVVVNLRAETGKRLSIAYLGNGQFTGKYGKFEFGFARSDVAGQTTCDPNAIAFADERTRVLKTLSHNFEAAVAETIYKALKKACKPKK